MKSISKYHDRVQAYVMNKLNQSGFRIIEFVYHRLCSEKLMKQLKECNAPECMFIRTLPDLIVFKDNKSMFVEIKSKSPKYENLALELFPLMVNYYLENIGLNVIYVYGEIDNNNTVKIHYLHTKKIIKLVSRVIITNKFGETINRQLKKFSERILKVNPEVKDKNKIKKRRNYKENVGSADPFVLIEKSNLCKFKNLDDLFQELG